MDPNIKIPKKFIKNLIVKLLLDNIFIERLGFRGLDISTTGTNRTKVIVNTIYLL